MTWPPLIERELRVALRKKRPVRSRLIIAGACSGGALLFLLLAGVSGSRSMGRQLHFILCLAGLYILFRVPAMTAGIFAEERRNQTLGLLFISGLSAAEVFISKVLSAALIAFTDLLAMFPLLALPFFIGGISFDLFLATVFALPNLLLLALSLSLLGSVLTDDDGTAVVVASVIALVICAVGPAFYFAQTHFSLGAKASPLLLYLSPAYGPYLIWKKTGSFPAADFWQNFSVTLGWSILCLGAAATVLKRIWRERQESDSDAGWRKHWQEMLHGHRQRRHRLAARWLDVNPFTWLAARDQNPVALAWLVVTGIVTVWLLCWAVWPQRWPSVPNLFITATLLNGSMRWLIQHTAAKTIGQSRQDGSYELLLTTPLSPSEVVWGQLEALDLQFKKVGRVVLLLNAVMMFAGLAVRPWSQGALLVYFMVWGILLWWAWRQSQYYRSTLMVMWASLNCGRPVHAVWRTSGLKGWWWIWVLFNLNHLVSKAPTFPKGSAGEIVFLLVMGIVSVLSALGSRPELNKREQRLVSEFREIVREQLPDRDDPRFKKWDHRERFPWGWRVVQEQLHERIARSQL